MLAELRRSQADRVVLVTNPHYVDRQAYEQENKALFDGIDFVRQNGYEPVVWLGGTIGHGGPLAHQVGDDVARPSFTLFTTTRGEQYFNTFCPMDRQFTEFICRWVQDLIKGGVRTLLLDDDFRLCNPCGDFGCCCHLHMAEYEKRLGEKVAREEIRDKVFTGPASRYRKVWRQMTGDTLENFAKDIRQAADAVDPTVRIGLCASPAGWDWDGTDALTLAKLLAGDTRPLLRLMAASYWAKMTEYRLGEVISYERLQAHWCSGEDVELLTEGDTYPRDRHRIPAAFLEGFDMALCADGQADGILKYMQLYVSSPRQERGYIDAHLRHEPDYAFLDTHFASKRAVGIQVIEPMHTIDKATLPKDFWPSWVPVSLKFLCENGIPHTFESGEYPALVFGEAARSADLSCLKNGAVLDMAAAELLMRRGVDVGITAMSDGNGAFWEYFVKDDDYIPQQGSVELKKLTLR
ncbi:MAG: hypothetical protein IIW40_03050, partial [Clostridia bacterium]|nr:hypothetical protein [Clostridia bacterium]